MSKNKNNPQIRFLQEIQKIAPTLLEEKEFEIKSGVVISDSVRKNLEDLDPDRNAELGYGSKIKREIGELETFIIENCPELIQQKQHIQAQSVETSYNVNNRVIQISLRG